MRGLCFHLECQDRAEYAGLLSARRASLQEIGIEANGSMDRKADPQLSAVLVP